MVFSSIVFLYVFLPVVLLIYYLIPNKFRNAFLLFADLIFYGWGEPILVFLMVFSIIINYFAGMFIDKFDNERKKKSILIIALVINLGLLAIFKYTGLIADNLKVVLPFINIKIAEIPLPIGISFYTFQIISYIIDVYRKETSAQHNIISFGAYVSLFPQLIAGPIVRYIDVDSQLDSRKIDFEKFSDGVRRFTCGLAKKVIIANSCGSMWDEILTIESKCSVECIFGVIAYSFQIYFDFSGYSDMAIGLGKMFGFDFVENFNYPYISKSITEFWRRWHISLGTWFREYLYIPLGGNRKGLPRQIVNLLIVWFLTGLWHGASNNFILWGLYFGAILIIEKVFLLNVLKKIPSFISHIYSLVLIAFGWVLFYFSEDVGGFSALKLFTSSMFGRFDVSGQGIDIIVKNIPLIIASIIFSTPLLKNIYNRISTKKVVIILEPIIIIAVIIICTASVVSNSYNPFLYFKF